MGAFAAFFKLNTTLLRLRFVFKVMLLAIPSSPPIQEGGNLMRRKEGSTGIFLTF